MWWDVITRLHWLVLYITSHHQLLWGVWRQWTDVFHTCRLKCVWSRRARLCCCCSSVYLILSLLYKYINCPDLFLTVNICEVLLSPQAAAAAAMAVGCFHPCFTFRFSLDRVSSRLVLMWAWHTGNINLFFFNYFGSSTRRRRGGFCLKQIRY